MFDAMHVLVACSGALQCATNALITTLLENGVSLEQLDAFHECQLTAAGRTWRLPPRFYTLKYNRKRNSALRGFARDCLVAVSEFYQLAVSRPVRREPREFVYYAAC